MGDDTHHSRISDGLIGDENARAAMETEGRFDSSSNDPDSAQGFFSSSKLRELVVCAVFFGVSLLLELVVPHERPIPFQLLENSGDYVRNLSYDEEFDGETVTTSVLILIAVVAPLFLQVTLGLIRRQMEDVHATLCVYLVSLGLNVLATDSVKLYVGYLRPIFYTVCEPEDDYQACTNESKSANDARKSFPSGHASISFCGLLLLTLYIHTHFGIPSIRKIQAVSLPQAGTDEQASSLWWSVVYTKKNPSLYRLISILSLLPMGLALFIAASRVRDNKHFPADVVGGAVLGGSIAVFCNSLWFDETNNY